MIVNPFAHCVLYREHCKSIAIQVTCSVGLVLYHFELSIAKSRQAILTIPIGFDEVKLGTNRYVVIVREFVQYADVIFAHL